MPNKTGVWNQEEADNNHIFSYRIAQFIGNMYDKNHNLFDFGCGKGAYCRYFEDIGFENVIGIDGQFYEGHENMVFIAHDLTKDIRLININHENFGKGNVICLEVGEHIPEEYLETFLDNITFYCDNYLILSWAVPGQEGIGHVSCRPNEWVISEMNKRGFNYKAAETKIIRSVPEGYVNYFKNTLMIFKKS